METKKIMWMLKKDLMVLWRHKPRLMSLLLFPIIMITLFGYGMGGSLENIPVVLVEQSEGPVTEQTMQAIENMSLYDVKAVMNDPDKAREMVENGEAKAAIVLPPDYEDLQNISPKDVVLYVDSSDQMASQAIIPATQGLFNRISSELGIKRMEMMGMGTARGGIGVNSTPVNPNQAPGLSTSLQNVFYSINFQIDKLYGDIDYIDFLVPAVLAMTVMFSCMFGMGESIAGERERGELARLFMTPTSVSTVVGGKIISKLIIETGRALILIIAAIILFGIVIKGGMGLTLLLLVLSALCFVGFGIMISARVGTQEDYMQMVMPFTMPMMFVSGVFYPLETMPWIFQQIAYLVPLTYANNALRSVMLKGAGIGDIWLEVLVLVGFTALFFALGVTKFNRDI
ncbi:ABC transporter permease [Methanobacterium alkalithermotolerans]|uniref:ABC transporter permease n=1 Tax=Methanobacterium alkalithermotolerans TaxID=2731220 RepID=A0A8T8KDN5_9EURY|nr:ABC transporter permease [Methanobacterium alkalithermotolerans]QUH23471.1 ABC transporter permease [Methanobacterium alkalithermotolerans]